jgi:hypothetical protein
MRGGARRPHARRTPCTLSVAKGANEADGPFSAACEGFADDASDDGGGVTAAHEVVAEAGGGTDRRGAAEGREPPLGDGASPVEDVGARERVERGVDQGRGDAARAQLRPQTRGAVTARRARLHPVVGEGGVVQVAAGGKIRDDGGGDIGRRAAAPQAASQLSTRPGASGEEVGGGEPRTAGVERRARGYFRLKGLGAPGLGGAWLSRGSSPIEKMPRTLRSKSSGLDALAFAVS